MLKKPVDGLASDLLDPKRCAVLPAWVGIESQMVGEEAGVFSFRQHAELSLERIAAGTRILPLLLRMECRMACRLECHSARRFDVLIVEVFRPALG